jgi:hypothetical protein
LTFLILLVVNITIAGSVNHGIRVLFYVGPGIAVYIIIGILMNRVLRLRRGFLRFLFGLTRLVILVASIGLCINQIMNAPLKAHYTRGPVVTEKAYWREYQAAVESGKAEIESYNLQQVKDRIAVMLAEAGDSAPSFTANGVKTEIPLGEELTILNYFQKEQEYEVRRHDGTTGRIPYYALSYATRPKDISTFTRLFEYGESLSVPIDPDVEALRNRYFEYKNGSIWDLKPDIAQRMRPLNLETFAKTVSAEDLTNGRAFDDVETDPSLKVILRGIFYGENSVIITLKGSYGQDPILRDLDTGETYPTVFTTNGTIEDDSIVFSCLFAPCTTSRHFSLSRRDPSGEKPYNFFQKTLVKVVKGPRDYYAWEFPEVWVP